MGGLLGGRRGGQRPGPRRYADPAKVHPIEHDGKHFRVPGIHLCEPSPQRTPVLYQAGASNRGKQFGAEHAEVMFIGAPTKEILRDAVADIRERAAAAGRDPYDVKIVNGHVVGHGRDRGGGARRARRVPALHRPGGHARAVVGLAGQRPLALRPRRAGRGHRQRVPEVGGGRCSARASGRCATSSTRRASTPRAVTVGSADQVADELQAWVEETDVDGFNLTNVITPGSFVDFVELVVPELQRRGAYRTSYDEGTLRDKLFGRGPRLPETHRAARYRRVTEEATR